jgi:hypothetical protein
MKARYFAYVAIAASLLLTSGSFAQDKVKPAAKKVVAVKDTTAKKAKHVKKAAKKVEKKAEEVK